MAFVRALLDGSPRRDFAVELWDGTRLDATRGSHERFTLVLRHPGALGRLLRARSDLAIGESYVYDDIDIRGDIEAAVATARGLLAAPPLSHSQLIAWRRRLGRLPAQPRPGRSIAARLRGTRSSVERDRHAVAYHYDRSNEFFATFLDVRMVYSCGYFTRPDQGLDEAQEQKLELICRKLRLQPGDRLLDVGCGWGALLIHAAQRHDVTAVGITLSEPQAVLARERIAAAGVGDRCRVELADYRRFDDRRPFDKLASIGMVEHVAPDGLRDYFGHASRLLRPGGVMLNHGIARMAEGPRSQFIRAYVFPDAELSRLPFTLTAAEAAGFEVRDVESLREHYALTLRHWVRRLEAHHEEAAAAAGEETYRVWRLYMAGSANAFSANRISVYQTLLVKPRDDRSGLPLTRHDWYVDG
jgi:cyclopropane-fatty-acyl-phospholipid synthase